MDTNGDYSRQFIGDGGEELPGQAFWSDTSTGVYRDGTDPNPGYVVSVKGHKRLKVSDTKIESYVPVDIGDVTIDNLTVGGIDTETLYVHRDQKADEPGVILGVSSNMVLDPLDDPSTKFQLVSNGAPFINIRTGNDVEYTNDVTLPGTVSVISGRNIDLYCGTASTTSGMLMSPPTMTSLALTTMRSDVKISGALSTSAGVNTNGLLAGFNLVLTGTGVGSGVSSNGPITCGTNSMTCGTLTCASIGSGPIGSTGLISGAQLTAGSSGINSNGIITSGTNPLTCGNINVNGTSILGGNVTVGTSSMTCGPLSSGSILASGTVSNGTNSMTCGALSSGSIVASGTVSSGTNGLTCGPLSCGSISSSTIGTNAVLTTTVANNITGLQSGTSFTPVIGDGTNNFTTSSALGRYVRIGPLVTASIYLIWSSQGSAVGASNLIITGLPSVGVSLPFYAASAVGYSGTWTLTGNLVVGIANSNSSTLQVFAQPVNGPITSVICSNAPASGTLRFTISYLTA